MEITGALIFYVFASDIHPWIKEMWGHLRTYTLYFLQYRAGQHTDDQITAAQNALVRYCQCAVRFKFTKLVTVLLHRACYHVPDQARCLLPTAYLREDWGERCIRRTKRFITGHATRNVASASAKCCLDEMALQASTTLQDDVVALDVLGKKVNRTLVTDVPDEFGVQLHELKHHLPTSSEVCDALFCRAVPMNLSFFTNALA